MRSPALILLIACGSIRATGCSSGDAVIAGGDGASGSEVGAFAGSGAAGGGGAPCVSPIECEGITNECVERTCEGGVCGHRTLKPPGTPSASQTPGDCSMAVCGEDGAVVLIEDDADAPDDGNDCTVDSCLDATPIHENAPPGTPCGAGGELRCDESGACAACAGDAGC